MHNLSWVEWISLFYFVSLFVVFIASAFMYLGHHIYWLYKSWLLRKKYRVTNYESELFLKALMTCIVFILFGIGSLIWAIGNFAIPSNAMTKHFKQVAISSQIVAGQRLTPVDISTIPEFTSDVAYWWDPKEICVHHCEIGATYGTGYGQIRGYWIRITPQEYEEIFKPYLLNECSTVQKYQFRDYIRDLSLHGTKWATTEEYLEEGWVIK